MAAMSTLEEDAKRRTREPEHLVGMRVRLINRMKGILIRLVYALLKALDRTIIDQAIERRQEQEAGGRSAPTTSRCLCCGESVHLGA